MVAAPVVEGAAAFEGGDHVIFVGHVERYGTSDLPALMFHRGRLMAAPAA
jgi:flavin reductase (DIM6/NTAB) family NADH-FMN oxidoreductase RutF